MDFMEIVRQAVELVAKSSGLSVKLGHCNDGDIFLVMKHGEFCRFLLYKNSPLRMLEWERPAPELDPYNADHQVWMDDQEDMDDLAVRAKAKLVRDGAHSPWPRWRVVLLDPHCWGVQPAPEAGEEAKFDSIFHNQSGEFESRKEARKWAARLSR